MMRRAAARLIPAAAADPDSGSSTSVTSPPQPRRKQTRSVLQVVRAAAPPVAVGEEEEVTSQVAAVEGSASSVVTGAALNRYLRTHGRIPTTRSETPDVVDLNAQAPPTDASRRPPPRQVVVYRPVICAYCNCAFCFGADEVPSVDFGPGHVYPAPREPITQNLLTPPSAWPLYRPDPWGPGGSPEWLLVCSNEHHFKATMGMMQQQQLDGAPSLLWRCTVCDLRVLPVVVGTEGSSSPDLHAIPAPPLELWRYAGAYWNFVLPGHENMVELKLHNDPLKLTLGRL